MTENPEVDFEAAYRERPPWEIGRPQPLIPSLIAKGLFTSPVLDVGCGTGENSIELARHGLDVCGIDSSPRAIDRALAKVASESLPVEFRVADAFELGSLERRFATVLDSALLHIIADRPSYAAQLAEVVDPDGKLILIEISDDAPIPYPKISESQIRETFPPSSWRIVDLTVETYETHLGTFPAWLALVEPIG